MAERWLAVLALMVNALVWGLSWWPFRTLQSHGLHPLWATALAYGLVCALLIGTHPKQLRALTRHPGLWLLMLCAGLTNVGFNWAVTVGDVVRVVLLFYLMPAWSVLFAWPLLGERPSARALARLALALGGVAVVLQPSAGGWPVPNSLPDFLALGAGAGFALNNIMLRRLADVPAASRVQAMFFGGALLASATAFWGQRTGWVEAPVHMPWPAWLAVGVLALAFLVGNAALQYGASRLPAQTTSLVMLSEVVFASLSAVALGAGELTARSLLGGALILGAAAWSAWPERSPPRGIKMG